MHKNIREVVDFDVLKSGTIVVHSAEVGGERHSVSINIPDDCDNPMDVVLKQRKIAERFFADKGLSLDDATPLSIPNGCSRPQWYWSHPDAVK